MSKTTKRPYKKRVVKTISPSSLAPIINCFMKGACLRGNCCTDLCTTMHEQVYGIRIQQKGIGHKIKCWQPCSNPADISKYKDLNEHQFHVASKLPAFLSKMTLAKLNAQSFADFEELFEYVALNSSFQTKYTLLVYNFALRYGYQRGIYPKDYVYLFAGAKEGAEHLLGKLPKNLYRKPTSDFVPFVGSTMKSSEIENFLCVCKECITNGACGKSKLTIKKNITQQ